MVRNIATTHLHITQPVWDISQYGTLELLYITQLVWDISEALYITQLVWDISILWDSGALILLICTKIVALQKQHTSLLVKTIYY